MARCKSLRGLMLAAWLGVACLFATALTAAPMAAADQPAASGGPLDILILVDNSHSLNRYDPFGLRADLVKALQQFYGDGRDRFAIADFAQKQVDFQAVKAEDWDKAVTQKLGKTNALTSDPSQALAGALASANGRATPNPLWVVVISDGDLNVYDPAGTPKPYIDAAFKAYSRDQVLANPGLINVEAERQLALPEGVKPFFAIKGTYTPVIFQEKAGAFYQALAGSAAQRETPVVLKDKPLQDLFLGLVRSRPGAAAPGVFGYAAKKIDGGQKSSDKIQLPEGHKRSRLVFFGLGEKFSVRVLQNGNEKASAAKTTGAEQYAVLNLETLPAGEYDFEITNTGRGQPLFAEYALFLSIDANAEIAATARTTIGELPFTIALRNAEKKTLTDAGILKDLKATITLQKASDANDRTAAKEYDLSKGKETLADVALPVALDADAGEYLATVRFQSLKLKGGAYGLDLTATTKIKLAPVLEVNFTHDPKTKHFVNETAGLVGQIKKGKAAEEKQTVTLVNKQGGEPVKVVLTKNSQGGYAGSFAAERAGEWTIKSEFTDTLSIGPGANPTFMATPFTLTVQAPVSKQVYMQEAWQPVFTSEDFKKSAGKDPEATLAITLAPVGAGGTPITVQLTLDKDKYAKDNRVKYDVTGGNRIGTAGQYALPAGYVGNTYTLVAPLELEVLARKFTLQYKKTDGTWADVSADSPAKVLLKLPWNEKWPEAPAEQKLWVQDKFNNQLNLRATVSLGMRGPGEPEKATLALVPIENKYSKGAMEAGANKDGLYRFQPIDGKNSISGTASENPYGGPQTGELTYSLQPGQAIKFDGDLCTYAAKVSVDGTELSQQPKFDVTIETPDKAW
ncbi:MAG TPA: vWA domain-containing protein, partial [Planctomycetota bacterium]|nr:vWA domain-containing protein [Planctomycetota bacterium]